MCQLPFPFKYLRQMFQLYNTQSRRKLADPIVESLFHRVSHNLSANDLFSIIPKFFHPRNQLFITAHNHAAFANRRKTLANSCKTYFAGRCTFALPDGRLLEGAPVVGLLPTLFAAASVDPRRRGETLDQQEFLALGQALLANAAEQARP